LFSDLIGLFGWSTGAYLNMLYVAIRKTIIKMIKKEIILRDGMKKNFAKKGNSKQKNMPKIVQTSKEPACAPPLNLLKKLTVNNIVNASKAIPKNKPIREIKRINNISWKSATKPYATTSRLSSSKSNSKDILFANL
jgi:hypothetical protein